MASNRNWSSRYLRIISALLFSLNRIIEKLKHKFILYTRRNTAGLNRTILELKHGWIAVIETKKETVNNEKHRPCDLYFASNWNEKKTVHQLADGLFSMYSPHYFHATLSLSNYLFQLFQDITFYIRRHDAHLLKNFYRSSMGFIYFYYGSCIKSSTVQRIHFFVNCLFKIDTQRHHDWQLTICRQLQFQL